MLRTVGSSCAGGRYGLSVPTNATAGDVIDSLCSVANPGRVANYARFFKTGPGEYGEGDLFLGLSVPQTRVVAKEFTTLDLAELNELVRSPFHEARFCALVILTNRYTRSKNPAERAELFALYLDIARAGYINNWDLVDVTAPKFGEYLVSSLEQPMTLLTELAAEKSLWLRRLSVLFTFAFLRAGELQPTTDIVTLHLDDREDLMHKACGWALREVGNRDTDALRNYLTAHAVGMPRTMLRYAIEKLPKAERKNWLLSSK